MAWVARMLAGHEGPWEKDTHAEVSGTGRPEKLRLTFASDEGRQSEVDQMHGAGDADEAHVGDQIQEVCLVLSGGIGRACGVDEEPVG